jgi:hypothetical protein
MPTSTLSTQIAAIGTTAQMMELSYQLDNVPRGMEAIAAAINLIAISSNNYEGRPTYGVHDLVAIQGIHKVGQLGIISQRAGKNIWLQQDAHSDTLTCYSLRKNGMYVLKGCSMDDAEFGGYFNGSQSSLQDYVDCYMPKATIPTPTPVLHSVEQIKAGVRIAFPDAHFTIETTGDLAMSLDGKYIDHRWKYGTFTFTPPSE